MIIVYYNNIDCEAQKRFIKCTKYNWLVTKHVKLSCWRISNRFLPKMSTFLQKRQHFPRSSLILLAIGLSPLLMVKI